MIIINAYCTDIMQESPKRKEQKFLCMPYYLTFIFILTGSKIHSNSYLIFIRPNHSHLDVCMSEDIN